MSVCTPGYSATSYADQARGASTLAWSNPLNASIGSPTATDPGFLPGFSSHWLAGLGFVPMPTIPNGSTLSSLTLYIRHRATSTITGTAVNLSAVSSGALSLSPAHAVPASFEDFAVDLVGLLPLTPAQFNAGLDVKIAYDAVPNFTEAYNPANWTVAVSPTSPKNGQAHYTLSLSQTWTITATWSPTTSGAIGKPSPSYVVLSVHSAAQGQGTGGVYPGGEGQNGITYPTAYEGTASADNGLGVVVSGPISQGGPVTDDGPEIPLYQRAESTAKRLVSVVGGVGTLAITNSASATVTGYEPQDALINLSLDASVVQPDATTVEVESMYLVACYDGSTPPPPPLTLVFPPDLSRIPPLRPETPTIR